MRFPPNLVEVVSTLVQAYQAIMTSLALGGDSCQTFGLSTTATAPGHPVTRPPGHPIGLVLFRP
jgi:hypothetical protein